MNPLDAGQKRSPAGRSRGATRSVAVAGRYGWLDRVLTGVDASNVGDFFPIPRYEDYQAKVEIDLRERETLAVLLLQASA